MDEGIKFTVIIPTRERADTLYHSLRSVVAQDYGNLNILVSDNFSGDGTREVVQSFPDARIRYINTGRRLAMHENWEFALAQVSGGYVTIIGDDDALLPHALRDMAGLIQGNWPSPGSRPSTAGRITRSWNSRTGLSCRWSIRSFASVPRMCCATWVISCFPTAERQPCTTASSAMR
jgi:glycosyltransferase involved in cell wall biosynthesis